jgi:thiamine-monophosphate kinase
MNELELIARLTQQLPTNPNVVVGPGDDCAVLRFDGEFDFLLKTDAVVEGVHFESGEDPRRVGRKALARCLSDIAAMAGTPSSALVTLGLPREFDAGTVEKIYEGINELAAKYSVAVVGGETTTNPERILISVALLGTVPKGRAVLRSGSRKGDVLFVSGQLGGSLSGKHLDFEPRLREAEWLAANFEIHAMIDLSDGLAGDLRHLLRAENLGAEVLASAIPISREAKIQARAESSAKPPLLAALTDGEDFELLFTAPGNRAVALMDAWKVQFPGTPLSCIGKIVGEPGVRLRDHNGVRDLNLHGYVHFQ